jgi:outer membrane autotransporter protein
MQCGPRDVSFRIIVSLSIIVSLVYVCRAGAAITATGSIDPNYDSSDPWNVGGDLTVGATANGTLQIAGGSQVLNGKGIIAADSGTTASILVTGAGSSWQTSGLVSVGDQGAGTLTISDGGSVTSSAGALVGYNSSTGHGSVLVTGSGSVWHVSEGDYGLRIGNSGSGDLVISDGGQVDGDYTRLVSGSSLPSTIMVTGSGSLLQMTYYVAVYSGQIEISDGGQVTNREGCLGTISGGTASARVTGQGSKWLNSGFFLMADDTELTISDGGLFSSSGFGMEPWAGHTSSVVVTGNGSLWDIQGLLHMGSDGNTSLSISDGGHVTSEEAEVQAYPGGTATVAVAGPNSLWTNTGTLTVGDYNVRSMLTVWHPEKHGTITVSDGGRVETDDMVVWYGSILTGDGTFKATQITNHGIIRPGDSIGTLTIEGNLTMDSNSILEPEVDNSGHSDKLTVTGNVQINHGTVAAISTEAITQQQQYTIIEANNVAGTFEGVDTSQLDTGSTIGIASLGYEPNAVLLNVTPTAFNDPALTQTRNESRVGSVLQQIASGGGNAVTAAVAGLNTYADVRHAYDQLSGQTQAPLGFVTAEGLDRHFGIISNRLHSATGAFSKGTDLSGMLASASPVGSGTGLANPLSMANDMSMATGPYLFALGNGTPYLGDQPWGVWGRGYGLRGDRETRDGISGYQYTMYGTCFGLDYRFSEQWLLGLTTGFSRGDIDHARSNDTADIDATHFGFYGSYEQSAGYVDFIADYADLDFETRRYVDVLDERLDGDFGGTVVAGYIEAGLKRSLSASWMLQPLASFQIVRADIDRFSESGGDSRLTFDDQQFESYKGSLGAKAIGLLHESADGSKTAVEFRGRWLHEFGDVRSSVRANFVTDPGLPFVITDAAAARDSALLGVGLDTWFSKAFRGFLDYDTELNRDYALHVVSAGLQYRW